MTTDTPNTCPHCGAFLLTHHTTAYCEQRTARQKAEAEVERLRQLLLASDLPVDLVNSHYPATEESSAPQL